MTTFKEIESAFESKFAIDESVKFKAEARCNHLAGLWAAQRLGLAGPQAEAYAKALMMADIEKPGTDSVFWKIRSDFGAAGLDLPDHEIRRTIQERLAQALAELKAAG